ncbi:MAG: hypothetical protein AABW82_01680 [Nanoarchaeota archaeon]
MKYQFLKKAPKYIAGAIALYTILHFTGKADLRDLQRHERMMNLPEYYHRFQVQGTNDLTEQQKLEMIVKNSGMP